MKYLKLTKRKERFGEDQLLEVVDKIENDGAEYFELKIASKNNKAN